MIMDDNISFGMRYLIWINIIIQTAFPLSIAFTSAIVEAAEQRFLPSSAHSAQTLQTGDEQGLPTLALKPAAAEDKQARKLAGYASQAGSFLAQHPHGDTAASLVRNMGKDAVGDEIQQWLSQFGTARVQLDANPHFSLQNSQLDLLVPLYEQKDSLVFTQGSLHRTDDRTQSNLGVGLRYFAPDYMLGGNLFWDYDISRYHARMGGGVEYWRDFIRFGANGYLGLTGWRASPDLVDYEERPANGWDLRAQAWLPWLPQLGGKLTWEQYYGREVALLGVDSRQQNPNALTAGINYTPVPLVTLGAEHRMEHDGKSDTRFSLGVNYQFGVPLRSQLEPSAVAAMRSLAGSRHDLVERNNNIVLAYRKKAMIQLQTADQVTGYAGEQRSLGVSVTSVYGLSRIDWDAAALTAAGGEIVQSDGDWAVVLPAYQSGKAGINTYHIGGVAVGNRGNRSVRSTTEVTVQEQSASVTSTVVSKAVQENSTIETEPLSEVVVKRKSRSLTSTNYSSASSFAVKVTLRDADRNEVLGEVTSLTSETIAVPNARLTSAWKDHGDGSYAATYTATKSGSGLKATLKLAEWAQASESATYSVGAGKAVQENSTVVTDKAGYASGEVISLTVTLKDSEGNAVAGALTADAVTVPNAVLKSAWKDNGDGSYAAAYTATKSGSGLKATLKLADWAQASESATYSVAAGKAVQENSGIVTDKAGYASGEVISLTVTLKDSEGNAVAGALTADAVTVPNAVLKSAWKDNGDGSYAAAYTATKSGSGLNATLQLSGWAQASESAMYSVAAGEAVQENSTIETEVESDDKPIQGRKAGSPKRHQSGKFFVVKVALKDAEGNTVTGYSLKADSVTVPNATPNSGWSDMGDGTYRAKYRATKAGNGLKARLKLASWSLTRESTEYAVDTGKAVQANSTVATDKARYTSGDSMAVTVTLKDAEGNTVIGESLTAETMKVANAILRGSWSDNGDGTYSAIWTATMAGTGLKATLKLADWAKASESAAYSVAAGKAVQVNSTITMDKSAYTAGDSMTVTVSLKNMSKNMVSGVTLSAATVAVPNAILSGKWTDNKDGTYRATYTATTKTGGGFKATLKLADWSKGSQSAAYSIYQTPVISMTVNYTSKGASSSTGVWTPVFTDDYLAVVWRRNTSDQYAMAQKVTITVKDAAGENVHQETFSTGKEGTMIVKPRNDFWGKTLTVEMVGKGPIGNEAIIKSSDIVVRNLEPAQIWQQLSINRANRTETSVGNDSYCRESWVGREHNNYVELTGPAVSFNGKTLIAPMEFYFGVAAWSNGNRVNTSTYIRLLTTSGYSIGGKFLFANDCWSNHSGYYYVYTDVHYAGNKYSYRSDDNRWQGSYGWFNNKHSLTSWRKR